MTELVHNMTAPNAVEGKIWNSWNSDKSWNCDKNSWSSDISNQKIVMDEQFGKNSVMDGKNDPKVVMDLSIFKFGGWHNVQPSHHKLLE